MSYDDIHIDGFFVNCGFRLCHFHTFRWSTSKGSCLDSVWQAIHDWLPGGAALPPEGIPRTPSSLIGALFNRRPFVNVRVLNYYLGPRLIGCWLPRWMWFPAVEDALSGVYWPTGHWRVTKLYEWTSSATALRSWSLYTCARGDDHGDWIYSPLIARALADCRSMLQRPQGRPIDLEYYL